MADNQNQSNSTGNDLDISSIEDQDQLAQAIEKFYMQDGVAKTQLSWNWEKNQMFLDGKQWLVYDGTRETGGVWKPLRVRSENEYIPRPVTNYIFDAYQTLKGYLIKSKPRVTVRPNTQTYRDKSAAKLATLVAETNYERLKEDQNYEYAASCAITYGTVFKKSYWDTSYSAQVKIPRMVDQPQVDPMTGQQIGIQQVPAVNPETGEPEFDMVPLGDVNTDIIEPYRMVLDPLANDLHKARWIMEYALQPLSWVQETFSKEDEGYTGKAMEVKPEAQLSNSMRRFYQLKTSSGTKGSYVGMSAPNGSDSAPENSAVVKEYYERPTAKHPRGRMVVVANGITLYVGESPYSGPDLGDWHPYSECRWEIVPGRFWGKSPFDDATEIQKQINSIDAVIVLTRKTMAIPQKLIPKNAGIAPGSWTGRPGQEISYNDTGTGAKPEIIPGVSVDEAVFMERKQRLEDFKNTTGAVDILKGDRPPGVTAASALNMLFEVGTGKLFPVLDRWKKFVENDQKKQLRIIADKYREPREDFIRMLMMKNTELSEEQISRFLGQDLYDNCNVVIEAGSNIPKLQSAEQATLTEQASTGALALDRPQNRSEYLRRLGLTGFDTDYGPDAKRAEWENDLLDNIKFSPDNQPVVMVFDNHEIHIQVHEDRMKEPSFMSLAPEVQQAFFAHVEEHRMQIEQAQQQQMMQAAAMGAPMPQPGQGQEAQSELPKMGKGITKELKNSLYADSLPPAQVRER